MSVDQHEPFCLQRSSDPNHCEFCVESRRRQELDRESRAARQALINAFKREAGNIGLDIHSGDEVNTVILRTLTEVIKRVRVLEGETA